MLPSVAYQPSPQFLPHQRLDHSPSANANANAPLDQQSCDLANAALNAALRRPLENMSGRSFAPMSSRTRHQYPQPIQRPPAQPLPPGSGLDTDLNHPEHSLRRKTPNGTIAAGFDATPGAGEGAIHPPASKHIIVSSLDNNSGQVLSSSRNGLMSDRGAQYNSTATPLPPPHYRRHANVPPALNYDATSNRTAYGGSLSQGVHGGNWIRSLNYPSGTVDPLLNQSSAQPHPQQLQRQYWQNGPAIPTVIASSFHPGRDQASPLGAGQYGPYWPDGGYIPFYPAALRDSRYQSTPSLLPPNVQDDPLATFQTPFSRQSIPSSEQVTPGFSWNPLPAQSDHQSAQVFASNNTNHHHPHQPQHSFPSRHNVLPKNSSEPSSLWPQQHPLSYQASHHHHRHHHTHPGVDGSDYSTQGVGSQSDSLPVGHAVDIASQPRNNEFKEKILSWAHSIYVDLLAALPSARKKGLSQNAHDPHSRNHGIYPKPPRQPGSDFSSSSGSGDKSGHSNRQHNNTFPFHPHPRTQSRHLDHNTSGFLDQRLASQLHVSPQSNSHSNGNSNSHFGSNRFDSHGHFVSSFDRRPSNDLSFDRPRNLRRSPAGPTSRLFSPVPYGVSTTENATAALEILSSLCIESGWEWIDGILVGGCLAYGLGDYNKAARWYSRIIQRDPSHVEAISNLAATLLALDRREDALQHWLRAVKLRPTYFDAIEHLIGLLCSSQRGKDAVNVIQFVENSLRSTSSGECFTTQDDDESDCDSETRESSVSTTASSLIDRVNFDYGEELQSPPAFKSCFADNSRDGYGSSGYNIPGSDNGRMLALVHAKGNMLYALGDHSGAATAFEDAILIGGGRRRRGMHSLIRRVLLAFRDDGHRGLWEKPRHVDPKDIVLLYPDKALQTAKLVFPPHGNLPGFQHITDSAARKTAVSTTSNSLLSLAKIYQDGMSSSSSNMSNGTSKPSHGVRDILALYYLSLSLQPSPSTANNVGILLASIQPSNTPSTAQPADKNQVNDIPGVVPGSGVALALAYYNYGLNLDSRHAHLYTNLGSLLKDIGQLPAAVKMYEQAVQCDSNFDIALANLANAVKDSGHINDAIEYYQRAVNANPDFAEAVCGLANALNSVCNWVNRGGISATRGIRDKWHVDEKGKLRSANETGLDCGWMKRVIDIVNKQLKEGEHWGCGTLATGSTLEQLCSLPLMAASDRDSSVSSMRAALNAMFRSWSGQKWEGSRIVRFIERAIKWIGWRWYQDRYVHRKEYPSWRYSRPQLPATLTPPNAPTVLPFHTFTCPLSAKQIRHISQRNGLRISCSTLRSQWLPATVYPPPAPPNPHLKVGYVSSDFNNHPLAHLMQSVFGLHDRRRVKAFCYATTASDSSVHRQQIEREAPVFRDVSSWSLDRLVEQIVNDGIHILINLNGYTRGARNEVFAARPAPIHMSFMGFAGTLGAEWCDYILADELSVPPETLYRQRRTARIEGRLLEQDQGEDQEDWVYGERIVFTPHTFFCCDHRQSAPDAQSKRLSWEEEQHNRWQMRKEMFPDLSDDTIILGNFNQLYKIEPTTFRTWLFILAGVPNAVLWLLRFPDVGEQNLRHTAARWAGEDIASRIIFTDVAPKHAHISRARICDLFLDTPECNAHTTSADVLWSGTPLLTYPRYKYKMCSRMASSILSSALPHTEMGRQAATELIASSDSEYERTAIRLGSGLKYEPGGTGRARGRLADLRKMLYLHRWESKLFDTRRWVSDLEDAYDAVWSKWVRGEEGDIWL